MTILEKLEEKLTDIVDNFRYEFNSDCMEGDAGIGGYEFWGSKGFDSQPYYQCCNEIKFFAPLLSEEEFYLIKKENPKGLDEILKDTLKSDIIGTYPEFDEYEYIINKKGEAVIYICYTSGIDRDYFDDSED